VEAAPESSPPRYAGSATEIKLDRLCGTDDLPFGPRQELRPEPESGPKIEIVRNSFPR